MTISSVDFGEFLYAHHPNWQCPFCGHGRFHMNVQAPDLVADLAVPVQPMGVIGLSDTPLTHNFYTLSCEKCGYTHWFHKAAVHRWIGQRPITGDRQ